MRAIATTAALCLLGLAVTTPTARAKDPAAIGRIGKQISVRIDGATQGSGVLVKREGDKYTILTAYHVVKGNQSGEELYVLTPDGKSHLAEVDSIRRLGDVDLAVLSIETRDIYQVASIGRASSVSSGDQVFVSGYPLPTTSVPVSIWRFLKGYIIANAKAKIPDGYQLLYSNPTLPGMSGGSVLDSNGKLIGIHGRSERDNAVSMATGKAVSTGTNQAIPITYYRQFLGDTRVRTSERRPTTPDDYLAQADSLFWKVRKQQDQSPSSTLDDFAPKYQEVIDLVSRSLSSKESASAYAMRAAAYINSGREEEGTRDYRRALNLDPSNVRLWILLGDAHTRGRAYDLGEAKRAWEKAIAIDPNNAQNARSYASIGYYSNFGRTPDKAIYYFNRSIELEPDSKSTLLMRAQAYTDKGQLDESYYPYALADYSTAIDLDKHDVYAISKRAELFKTVGRYSHAIKDYTTAISICESKEQSSKQQCDTDELRRKREDAYRRAP